MTDAPGEGKTPAPPPPASRTLAAAGLILGAMAVIGLIDQFVVVIAETSSLWTFHILRTAMIVALAATWLIAARRDLRVRDPRAVLAYAAARSGALMLYFAALGSLSVAQAAAGLFTAPLWVTVLSLLLFRLPVGPVRAAAAVVGFAGVLLVLAPDPRALDPMIVAAVAAGALYALSAIATREWCGGESALALSLSGFLGMAVWSVLGLAVVAVLGIADPGGADGFLVRGLVAPTPEVWAWIAVQAVGSLVAVVFLTRAYQIAEASIASVFEYSVLGFSALFGWLIWGEATGPWGLVGLALIAGAGAVIATRGGTDR